MVEAKIASESADHTRAENALRQYFNTVDKSDPRYQEALLLYPKVRVKMLVFLGFFITTFTIPAIWMLGYWFVAQLIGGVGSIGARGGGVAFWAHIGGFLAGVGLVLLFQDPELVRRHPHRGWRAES